MASARAALAHAERVARRFGARASQYDEHALLQREAAHTLAAFIGRHAGLPFAGPVVEIGCGTGLLSALLALSAESYLATDIAPEMLERCQQRLGDLPHMAFAVLDGETARFDTPPGALVTNLAAQWFRDPVAGLSHLARQTRLFCCSVPLAGSFPEWEDAFRALGRRSGLLPLPEEAAVMGALSALPGRRALFQVIRHEIDYPDARAFADNFRKLGADTPRPGYAPGPIKPILKRFAGGMRATVRVLYALVRQEKT